METFSFGGFTEYAASVDREMWDCPGCKQVHTAGTRECLCGFTFRIDPFKDIDMRPARERQHSEAEDLLGDVIVRVPTFTGNVEVYADSLPASLSQDEAQSHENILPGIYQTNQAGDENLFLMKEKHEESLWRWSDGSHAWFQKDAIPERPDGVFQHYLWARERLERQFAEAKSEAIRVAALEKRRMLSWGFYGKSEEQLFEIASGGISSALIHRPRDGALLPMFNVKLVAIPKQQAAGIAKISEGSTNNE